MSDVIIVVSHRGWDGTRLLGVFASKEDALNATANFPLAENEELIFDYLTLNKISSSAISAHSGKKLIERKHVYT